MKESDSQLVTRWFNRAKRFRKSPSDAVAERLLKETTDQLLAGVKGGGYSR